MSVRVQYVILDSGGHRWGPRIGVPQALVRAGEIIELEVQDHRRRVCPSSGARNSRLPPAPQSPATSRCSARILKLRHYDHERDDETAGAL
jgi:hypothetical protein